MNKITKVLAGVLSCACIVGVMVGCNQTTKPTEEPPKKTIEGTAEEIIEKINVAAYGENYMESEDMIPLVTSSRKSLEEMYRSMYEGEADMLTDALISEWVTGQLDTKIISYHILESMDGVVDVAYSQPMMGSPYFVVVVRFDEKTDVKAKTKYMYDNADRRAWICMEADEAFAACYGDVGVFAMMDSTFKEEMPKLSVENYSKAFATVCGEEVDYIAK